MQEVLDSHRPELSSAEEAHHGGRSKHFLEESSVMVRRREESGPTSIASEEQGPCDSAMPDDSPCAFERRPEVLVGGIGVAHMELDRLADGNLVADRECT